MSLASVFVGVEFRSSFVNLPFSGKLAEFFKKDSSKISKLNCVISYAIFVRTSKIMITLLARFCR